MNLTEQQMSSLKLHESEIVYNYDGGAKYIHISVMRVIGGFVYTTEKGYNIGYEKSTRLMDQVFVPYDDLSITGLIKQLDEIIKED